MSPNKYAVSGIGKTTYLLDLIKYRDQMFDKPPQRIIYSYRIDQPKFRQYDDIVEFVKESDYQLDPEQRSLLILDDQSMSPSIDIAEMFCVTSHHKNVSIFFVTHNLFHNDPKYRTAGLNTQYFILFKSPRGEGQVATLARQLHGCNKNRQRALRNAYGDCVMRRAYGHLLIDLSPQCPDSIRLRSDTLPCQGQPFMNHKAVKCYGYG